MAEKRSRTERRESEMNTEGGREAGTSQLQSRLSQKRMTNIYLTDSEEEAFVDLVKDHQEHYGKTNEHFKDNARKDCLWEKFSSSC